jgi:hypothetical protein
MPDTSGCLKCQRGYDVPCICVYACGMACCAGIGIASGLDLVTIVLACNHMLNVKKGPGSADKVYLCNYCKALRPISPSRTNALYGIKTKLKEPVSAYPQELITSLMTYDKMAANVEDWLTESGRPWSTELRRAIVMDFLRFTFFGEIRRSVMTSEGWTAVGESDQNS